MTEKRFEFPFDKSILKDVGTSETDPAQMSEEEFRHYDEPGSRKLLTKQVVRFYRLSHQERDG